MGRDKEFHDYVMGDVFAGVLGVTSRPMFGGYGIYKNGVFFALIADGELYFKADAKNRNYFEELGAKPFVYTNDGKSMTMSYWSLPEEIMENKHEIAAWVERSVDAAVRSRKPMKARKSKSSRISDKYMDR